MINYLAQNAVKLYINSNPNNNQIVNETINSIFEKELMQDFPLLYPLVNLIDIGITNYNDV